MNQAEETKKCSKCGEIKPIINFQKRILPSGKNSHYNQCKSCKNLYQNFWNKSHFKPLTEEQKLKSYKRLSLYYKTHPEKRAARNKRYRQAHPEKCKEIYIKYKPINNERQKLRRKTDIKFKLIGDYRNRLNQALKNNQKYGHSVDLLMCSTEEWKKHIELQFVDGMSWNNRGLKSNEWSIDHIIPCDFFDLSDPVEQYMCFRWQNTRPIWHVDNVKKSNKLII